MWSGKIGKRRLFRMGSGIRSELSFSKEHNNRIKTQNTSAETLTQISEHTIRQSTYRMEKLTLMNDDFREREVFYTQSFVLRKHRLIRCQISKTEKFWYMSLYDHKADKHYKLRLLKDTGNAIFIRFWQSQKQFRDYISQDQLKRFYFSAPYPPFERKFYFTPMEPTSIMEEKDDHDLYIRQIIANLDRDLFIFGKDED